jgi:hypothetical protein
MKRITLSLVVDVPENVDEFSVAFALNAALDEPPADWGDWTVGSVVITDTQIVED